MVSLPINKILQGHTLDILKGFPDESIDMIITSPPYWSLRDYNTEPLIWDAKNGCEHEWSEDIVKKQDGGTHGLAPEYNEHRKFLSTSSFCSKCSAWRGSLGLEPDFNLFVKHLCDIFDEGKRVLKKTGTCWVNIGDTYYTKSGSSFENDNLNPKSREEIYQTTGLNLANEIRGMGLLESKNLTLVPFRFAIEMQKRGWIIRNVILWEKPNPMPTSVTDRFSVDFEYVFFFVKNKKYYFEQQIEEVAPATIERAKSAFNPGKSQHYGGLGHESQRDYSDRLLSGEILGRNKRCIWRIPTRALHEAHFAPYPEDLIETPIIAGSPEFVCKQCGKPREKIFSINQQEQEKSIEKSETKYDSLEQERDHRQGFDSSRDWIEPLRKFIGYSNCNCGAGFEPGIVLDPFMGSGTTALKAKKLGRNYIGIELNPEYVAMANSRVSVVSVCHSCIASKEDQKNLVIDEMWLI